MPRMSKSKTLETIEGISIFLIIFFNENLGFVVSGNLQESSIRTHRELQIQLRSL